LPLSTFLSESVFTIAYPGRKKESKMAATNWIMLDWTFHSMNNSEFSGGNEYDIPMINSEKMYAIVKMEFETVFLYFKFE
jgi:hypothetical protein